jgi:hypothetical protein
VGERLTLAVCASQSPRQRDAEAYERYRDFAGAPVDEFTYLGRYDGCDPPRPAACAVVRYDVRARILLKRSAIG